MFYSNDELLHAEFEHGLDEVAHAIEWSDPKNNVEQEKHCSPFKSAMVVPVILGLISDNPGCTNKTLRGYLKAYGKEYTLTELILQEAFDRKV